MQVYLDTPIQINGTEIRHTQFGLKYLIEHYEHILEIATPKQLDDNARQHIIITLLPTYKFHLSLYQNQK